MKEYVSRAMLVSCLIGEQLERLQLTERKIGWTIPNWNVYEVLKIQSYRERAGVPDDNDAQVIHNLKIEREIQRKGWNNIEPQESYLEWLHIFDWNVHNKAHEIIWDYSGRNKDGLVSRLRSIML